MSVSPAFEWTCAALEAATTFNSLEARGTIRIALKGGGLEAATVTPDQMKVVLEKILASELKDRGVADTEALCRDMAVRLAAENLTSNQSETPDAVFARLGGRSN